MAKLRNVRYNPELVEQFKKKHPELKDVQPQALIAIMLRKALEADQ